LQHDRQARELTEATGEFNRELYQALLADLQSSMPFSGFGAAIHS